MPGVASTYQVTIGERVLTVALRRDGIGYLVRVDDGEEQPVDIGTVDGPLHWLALGERRVDLLAAQTDNGTLLAIDGLDYRAEVVDAVRARLAAVAGGRQGSHGRRELKAPMPGLLVKILCAAGDTVEPGQPLAVLQAMKMENELSLARGGTVSTITAEAGQTVEQGQIILTLE
ncbi:MAG TPA: biotin/lipoyl-containing protein [Chloroflexota bacterium]|jgi:propionyl-CoA carboxylase alpha chain|nr:biotin/lipoyl-containing protein [Chloroflexota bacterium]